MSETITMKAEPREHAGKGAARAARRGGRTPGVIYGGNHQPEKVLVDAKQLHMQLTKAGFFNTLVALDLDGASQQVLVRDVQIDPLTDLPLHVDFLRVTAASAVTVDVPVQFVNEEASPGLKRGGVLNVVRHAIEVTCGAGQIPGSFTLDLAGLDIGDSLHISQIEMPAGVTPTIADRDFTIASGAAPSAVKSAAAEVEEEEVEEEVEQE